MNVKKPLTLLGGISPAEFMQTYWQRKPLLVRQAIPNFSPLLDRAALFQLAGQEGVEYRLVQGRAGTTHDWRLRRGPFQRRALPKLSQSDWTLLVQGVDLHHDGVAALMQQFRFLPDARLDDLMISFAVDGGGVGPHFDSYDVFLLQAHGQRRWRIGRQKDDALVPDMPLKILANFKPEQEWVLNPGDMLYLPPRYAHDGVALGECMTYSVGFRAPNMGELASDMLGRLSEDAADLLGAGLYQDAAQPAVSQPAAMPKALQSFAQTVVQRAVRDPRALARALGEHLTEPKHNIWFESAKVPKNLKCVQLDKKSRMLYDDHHVFLNGESWLAAGKDAALMRELANARALTREQLAQASPDALSLLKDWCEAGWLHAETSKK